MESVPVTVTTTITSARDIDPVVVLDELEAQCAIAWRRMHQQRRWARDGSSPGLQREAKSAAVWYRDRLRLLLYIRRAGRGA